MPNILVRWDWNGSFHMNSDQNFWNLWHNGNLPLFYILSSLLARPFSQCISIVLKTCHSVMHEQFLIGAQIVLNSYNLIAFVHAQTKCPCSHLAPSSLKNSTIDKVFDCHLTVLYRWCFLEIMMLRLSSLTGFLLIEESQHALSELFACHAVQDWFAV